MRFEYELTQDVAERIKAKRKLLDIQQLNVAMAIGMSQSLYCKIETGARVPKITTMYKLADVFECSILDLLPTESVEVGELLPFDKLGDDNE